MTSYTDARPEGGLFVPLPRSSRQFDAVGDNGQLVQSSLRTRRALNLLLAEWRRATWSYNARRGAAEGRRLVPTALEAAGKCANRARRDPPKRAGRKPSSGSGLGSQQSGGTGQLTFT